MHVQARNRSPPKLRVSSRGGETEIVMLPRTQEQRFHPGAPVARFGVLWACRDARRITIISIAPQSYARVGLLAIESSIRGSSTFRRQTNLKQGHELLSVRFGFIVVR
jgi:hypothetical protein